MSSARAGGFRCPQCGQTVESAGWHYNRSGCPAADGRTREPDVFAVVREHRQVHQGVPGFDPHRVDFSRTVRGVSWDDVPTLDDEPDYEFHQQERERAEKLADELEAEEVWPTQ